MDPLSYNLLVQPLTGILLVIFLIVCFGALPHVPLASYSDYLQWWPHLVANATVATLLNLSVATFINMSSAIGFIVAGIFKDVTLVLADVVLSGTELSKQQAISFFFQLVFATSYALL